MSNEFVLVETGDRIGIVNEFANDTTMYYRVQMNVEEAKKIVQELQEWILKKTNDSWVDSLMNKLSLDQKIGQLFMIQAYSNLKNSNTWWMYLF